MDKVFHIISVDFSHMLEMFHIFFVFKLCLFPFVEFVVLDLLLVHSKTF